MKGRVLGYDTAAEATVIRGEDGVRYRFASGDWRERHPPRRGDEIDFEPDGAFARAVFLTGNNGSAIAGPASALSMLARHPLIAGLVERPILAASLLVLVACLPGAYQIDGAHISLFAMPELISRLAAALDGVIAATGTDPAPRIGAGVARLAMALLLLLYIVPVLAGLVAWRELTGRRNLALARMAGMAAMVLPVIMPLAVVLIVRVWVVPGIAEPAARLGRDGLSSPLAAFDVLQLYATGTVFVVAAGGALWAAAAGRLRIGARPVAAAGDNRSAPSPEAERRGLWISHPGTPGRRTACASRTAAARWLASRSHRKPSPGRWPGATLPALASRPL